MLINNYSGTERTLILKSQGWRYNKKGFEEVFLPLSETCRDPSGEFIFEDEFDHLIILMSVPPRRRVSLHVAGLLRHAGGGPPHRGQRQPPAPLPPARRARRPGGQNSKVTHTDHARVIVY